MYVHETNVERLVRTGVTDNRVKDATEEESLRYSNPNLPEDLAAARKVQWATDLLRQAKQGISGGESCRLLDTVEGELRQAFRSLSKALSSNSEELTKSNGLKLPISTASLAKCYATLFKAPPLPPRNSSAQQPCLMTGSGQLKLKPKYSTLQFPVILD